MRTAHIIDSVNIICRPGKHHFTKEAIRRMVFCVEDEAEIG